MRPCAHALALCLQLNKEVSELESLVEAKVSQLEARVVHQGCSLIMPFSRYIER